MKSLRVILADDHTLVRAGLRGLLEKLDGIEVIAEADDGPQALRLIEQHRPDLALLDISMPKLNGLEVTAQVTKRFPQTRVLILSMHSSEEYARQAIRAGAAGYLVLGRDIIPDDIPLLGGLDDLVVLILAVELFLDQVPTEVLHEKLDELGIERAAFEQDVAQIRRLTPRPIRAALRRVPDALGAAIRAVDESGIGPRLRSWINREGSPA